MIAAVVFAIIQASGAIEALPIDARMAEYEAAMPEFEQIEALAEAEIGRLGPAESGWATSGISGAAAIAARRGNAVRHVLGEWEKGGHGVVTSGDRPLGVPQDLHRYTVRVYDGSVDYHAYHRLSPGIVIHTFGSVIRIGNSECQHYQGIELISRETWRNWAPRAALTAFSIARATRDDARSYCIIFRPVDNGSFLQLAYTPEGRPYIALNEDAQAFVVTTHAEAAVRIFGTESSPPTTD